MRKILEEFYFGNLRPSERRMTPSSSLRQTVSKVSQCERQLMEQLNEGEQAILKEMVSAPQKKFIKQKDHTARLCRFSDPNRIKEAAFFVFANLAPFFRRIQRRVQIMNCKAILSNRAHPEYGQATVPFPIPDSEYDHTIGLLENMGIGSPTAQDCRVDELDSPYPVLNRLVTQSANVWMSWTTWPGG